MKIIRSTLCVEFEGISCDHISGCCEIISEDDDTYVLFDEDSKIVLRTKDYGDYLFRSVDELTINGEKVRSIKEWCIDEMKKNGYTYNEDEGFIKNNEEE